jgi:cytochrome c
VCRLTRRPRRLLALLAPVAMALAVAGCGTERPATRPPAVTLGDVDAGREAIVAYGCGGCHAVPGVRGATALVGPPLEAWSQRSYIAGMLANTPPNLERWIRDPQGVQPGNAMPDLGVTEVDARDMTAYLFSLE